MPDQSDQRQDPTPLSKGRRISRTATYEHPKAFWFGVAAVTVGVMMHLPFYFSASDRNYSLAGETPDKGWMFGLALIFVGLASTAYGLFPRLSEVSRGYVSRIRVRALDEAKIS